MCGCRRRTSSPPCSPRNQLESRVKPCVRMRSARLGFSSETNSTLDLSLAPGLAVSCLITKVPSVQAHPHTLCHPLRHVNRPSPVRALSVQSQSLLYSPILVLLIRKKKRFSAVAGGLELRAPSFSAYTRQHLFSTHEFGVPSVFTRQHLLSTDEFGVSSFRAPRQTSAS